MNAKMLAWEKRMCELQQRDDKIDRRDRLDRARTRPFLGRRQTGSG